jgi:CBS domain-containing protein
MIAMLATDVPAIVSAAEVGMIGKLLHGKKPLVSMTPAATVAEVLAALHRHRIGAVLIVEHGLIHGLVSERDICRALHERGGAVLDDKASEVMSSPVVTARPCDSVAEAMEVMTQRRFRHLPVVEKGEILGLVSIGDLVKQRIEEAEAETAAMKEYISS